MLYNNVEKIKIYYKIIPFKRLKTKIVNSRKTTKKNIEK